MDTVNPEESLTVPLMIGGTTVAVLLALASYHYPRKQLTAQGTAVMIAMTVVALLGGSLGEITPQIGAKSSAEAGITSSIGIGLVTVIVMALILGSHSRAWAIALWVIGVVSTVGAIPFLALGEAHLALGALVGGPGILMFVAFRHPSIPASLTRFGLGSEASAVTQAELEAEKARYTRVALTLTSIALFVLWRSGGVPERPVAEAKVDLAFDSALADQGKTLATEYGCRGCHSIDGSAGSGPTWKGTYGEKVRLSTGKQVVRDEAYIRESIVNPDAKVVANYSSGSMVAGLGTKLTNELTVDANVKALVEYYKSVRAGEPK
jgi:cytochrome c